MSGDESTNLCVMLKKKEALPEETYYFRITVDFEVVPEDLRVTVIPMINDPDTYCDTKEEAYAAVRSIIRNRTNNMARYHGATNNKKYDTDGYVYDRIYVSQEAFGGNDMDMYDVCDFDAERDGMLPYEGDYMYNLIGNRKQKAFGFEGPTIFDSSKNAGSSGSNDEILGDTVVDGKSYYIYEVYLPVITTKEEEDKVDAKVAELMETEFASVKDATNKEKIQKIYSYIINHVSGTVSGAGGSDREYLLYHTAYHALIKGNGTCESFGQLFTRLSRELGVASKVIMGQDSSAHTYNIVDGGDGYWYYIDCSTKRGLSDSGHFYRSEEQERYTRPRFVINYLQKLKGGTNINVKTIKIIQDGVQVSEALTTKEVSEYITANDTEGTSWTIHFDSDWTLELDSEFYFGGGLAKRVYIDLGGHTIKCKNSCDFSVNTIFGGNIQAGYSDKISSYSGNVIIHNGVRVKDVTFTSATSFDYVIFDLPGGTAESEPEEFYLDNVVFKKLRVMVTSLFIGEVYAVDYSYRYELNVETPVTFENCTFGMIDDSLHKGPAVTLSKGAKLIFNGTNTIGHVRYPQPEEGGDGFIYSPVNAIEFIPAGGNFGNGDILVTNNGTLKKITKTDRKGTASGAALSDIVSYEKTNAHVAEGDEASLMVIGNDLTFAKPVFALSAEGSDIGAFVTWNDLGKWFSANGNTQTDYTVTLLENSVNPQSITFPSKAKSIKVTAKDLTGEKYVFGSTGNIKLVTDTEFVGLALKHAAKSAVLDLGGKKLTLTGTTSDMYDNGFMSVKGAGASTLVVGDDSFIQADTVTCSNIELLDGGKLCGYNGLTAASAELHGGSTLALRKTGTVTKLTVTETTEEKKAVFERIEDAILNIKTSYTCTAAGDKLSVTSKTVHGVLCRTEPGATVITTGIKEFPLEKLTALQPAGSEDYNTAIRTGNNISFACAWFELTADNAPEESLGTYAKWSDVTAAIDKLGNSMMSYTVHVIRDANTMGKITMPKKAGGLTVTGADENRVSLTFTGDISVTMPVKFKHLDLDNNDKKEPKLILGKHTVSFIDCSTVKDTRVFLFGSVSGKAGSTLIIDRAEATQRCTFGVSGSVNVGTLKVDGYQLDVYGALTSSALASFKSVRLTVSGNISFKDVISRDDNNEIIYGTDRKNTSFKIKGNVTALEEDETSGTSLDLEIEDKAGNRHIVNKYAISVRSEYYTSNDREYTDKKDLIAGAKVPACMIVVQRHMDQGVLKILYATKKVKKALRIAASAAGSEEANVYLYDDRDIPYTLGAFGSIQSALNEIKTYGNRNGSYLIEIATDSDYAKEDTDGSKKYDTVNLAIPAAAAEKITIQPKSAGKVYLHVKNSISVGSNVVFKDLTIAEPKDKKGSVLKLNISLGGNSLTFDNVSFTDDRIGKISGNGVSKTSMFAIIRSGSEYAQLPDGAPTDYPDYKTVISGNLTGVGTLALAFQEVFAKGKINIGNLDVTDSGSDSYLYGYATVKRDKKTGKITSVATPITLAGNIDSSGDIMNISLLDKATGKEILGSEDIMSGAVTPADPAFAYNKPAFQVIKAPKTAMDTFSYPCVTDDATDEFRVIKLKGVFYVVGSFVLRDMPLYELLSKHEGEGFEDLGTYYRFTDAVWDINSRKDKTAIYTICVDKKTGIDGALAKENLTMPKAGTAKELIIASDKEDKDGVIMRAPIYYKKGATIKLTCNTTFDNIAFTADDFWTGLNLNLGGYKATLIRSGCFKEDKETGESTDIGFETITGNGVGKSSELRVDDLCGSPREDSLGNKEGVSNPGVTVKKKLSGVGCVTIRYTGESDDPEFKTALYSYGITNIGTLRVGRNCYFQGGSNIKLNKEKTKVTAVNTNVTIANAMGTVEFDENGVPGEMTDDPVETEMWYKTTDGSICPVITAFPDAEEYTDGGYKIAEIEALGSGKFQIVKSAKVKESQFTYRRLSAEDYKFTKTKNVIFFEKK